MFTGLIEDLGTVHRFESVEGGRRFLFATELTGNLTRVGDSIAVNGVCLTVTDLEKIGFWADASSETLNRSNLKSLRVGERVNLERALRVGDRLGGHFVTGHVDGTAPLLTIERDGQVMAMIFQLPGDLLEYVAVKGSITIDGVSLTVNAVDQQRVAVLLIPHTLKQTIFQFRRPGDQINIETDMLAKYLERLIGEGASSSRTPKIDLDFLAKHGYS